MHFYNAIIECMHGYKGQRFQEKRNSCVSRDLHFFHYNALWEGQMVESDALGKPPQHSTEMPLCLEEVNRCRKRIPCSMRIPFLST
eukprot:scaffold210904_cov18-Tisochrysis_lutea.AAC.1